MAQHTSVAARKPPEGTTAGAQAPLAQRPEGAAVATADPENGDVPRPGSTDAAPARASHSQVAPEVASHRLETSLPPTDQASGSASTGFTGGSAAVSGQPASFAAGQSAAGAAATGPSQTAAQPPPTPVAGLAAEITARAAEGRRRFEIRLDPPELGRIDVRLDFARDGQLMARLVVDRSETLDLLRRDSANLERALESAGLRGDQAGLQLSLRDHSGGRWQAQDDMPRPDLIIVPDEDVAVREAVQRAYGVLRSLGDGIDIRI
jgi:flagellar hook-length control protein FliK